MKKRRHFLHYLYHVAQKERNPLLLTIYDMANRFYKTERMTLFEHVLKSGDLVAVHALKMTQHQRSVNRERHVNVNGVTYYLFDRRSVWQFGVVTEPEQYIYT